MYDRKNKWLDTLYICPICTHHSEVTLLHIPADSVRECVNIDEGGKGFSKEIMMNWCVKK